MPLLIREWSDKNSNSLLFTFHYASTYTIIAVILINPVSIFTFHYASTYTKPGFRQSRSDFKFTFHYASTYTQYGVSVLRWKMIFTFHYASTYTPIQNFLGYAYIDLHSTMPLLIQITSALHPSVPCIYIPLCLYLYGAEAGAGGRKNLFTFHYASTYTSLQFRTGIL